MMIALTVPEIRRLLLACVLVSLTNTWKRIQNWSWFRRRRQWQARASHYRRRGHTMPIKPPLQY